MEQIVDFIIHIDENLVAIIDRFGVSSYLIIFLIVFAETGLVVTPFLPGDSLLFAIGALATKGGFNILVSYVILLFAAILGDASNYYIGHHFGKRAFTGNRFFSQENLLKTEEFYKKHGGKTIIFARFIPIIRTFAPFVAGACKMNYEKFFRYNVVGAVAWVTLFLFAGYFFGGIPFIEKNFTIVIFVIIGISVLPGIYHFIKSKLGKNV